MRGAAPFACQFLWPFELHSDSRIGPAWLSARIPIGDQWRPCLHALHVLDHWRCQFLLWRVGALALIQGGQVVSPGSCDREPPAFDHSDWLGLPVWPVVARVQECCRVVAWMLERGISVTSWTGLTSLRPRSSFDWGLREVRCGAAT